MKRLPGFALLIFNSALLGANFFKFVTTQDAAPLISAGVNAVAVVASVLLVTWEA